jgi:hypothetical protein
LPFQAQFLELSRLGGENSHKSLGLDVQVFWLNYLHEFICLVKVWALTTTAASSEN